MTPAQAWPLEARQTAAIAQLDRAVVESRLHLIKPGFFAGTYGLTKEWVRQQIMMRNELAGGDGK